MASPQVLRVCIDANGRFIFLFQNDFDESFTTLVYESGGAVTYCVSLSAPTASTVSTVPRNLAAHARIASAMIYGFGDIINNVVHETDRSSQSGVGSWLDDWAERACRVHDSPLYWEEDSAAVAFAWARAAAVGACPVVPCAALSLAATPSSTRPSPWSTTLRTLRDVRAPGALSPVSNPTRAHILPVLLWTNEYMAFLTDGSEEPRVVTGFAWREPCSSCDPAMPGLDVYEWSCTAPLGAGAVKGEGYFTYSKVPGAFGDPAGQEATAHVVQRALGRQLGDDGITPPDWTPAVPATPVSTTLYASGGCMDGREAAVRRLLAASGVVDPRAAHPQSVKLAVASLALEQQSSRPGPVDTGRALDIRMGPGPHTFPVCAVPHANGGGVLARAAAAARRIASTGPHAASCVAQPNPHAPPFLPDCTFSSTHQGCVGGGSTSVQGREAREEQTTGEHMHVFNTSAALASATASSLVNESSVWESERHFRLLAAQMAAARHLRASSIMRTQMDMMAS